MQETLHHAVTVDAPNRVNLGPRDRLLVGDDRQGFESGATQVSCRFQTKETLDQFGEQQAPVQRIGSKYAPVPFSPPLEQAFLYSEDEVTTAIKRMMG